MFDDEFGRYLRRHFYRIIMLCVGVGLLFMCALLFEAVYTGMRP